MIIEEVLSETFRLVILKEDEVPRTWHYDNLMRYCI